MLPRVCVVIATRDRPVLVREALAAVLAQDYAGEIEVVVVHDRSEPDLDLVRGSSEAPGRSVRVVANRRSEGLAGARNTGIEETGAELVAFCDDDDVWMPDKLSVQVPALLAVPDAVLATCGISVEYAGARSDRVLELDRVDFRELLRDRHTELHPSTFLLRRAALVGGPLGLVDELVPGGFGEDYDLLLRAARVHPVVNVRTPHVVVRWGAQSFFFRRWATMAEGLTWLLEHHPEFDTVPRGHARVQGQIAFAHAARGERRQALRWAACSLRSSVREPRGVLAAAVAVGAVRASTVMETLHRRGRGI